MLWDSYNQTINVFGIKNELIASYLDRELVDDRFKSAIKDGKEVVVYGASKQGKTSLILRNISEQTYVKVECSPKSTPIDIYKSILRQLDVTFYDSISQSLSHTKAFSTLDNFKISIPCSFEYNKTFSSENDIKIENSTTERMIDYNLSLSQDVIELFKKYLNNKYIILENFHYLNMEVQEQLAYDLRSFRDNHIVFIILGIWRESNRLVQFNGDLLDRVTEVPVEPWRKEDLSKVIDKGSELLNVDFTEIKDDLILSCFNSIGILQELCKECCLNAGVISTSNNLVVITKSHLENAIKNKVSQYGIRHVRNFESFVEVSKQTSSQSGKPTLAIPYYFIKILLSDNKIDMEQGLSRKDLLDSIRSIHHRPDDVRSSDIGSFLNGITQYQINRRINPPFIDYDAGVKRLKIIDSTLFFFLRYCDKEEILSDLINPLDFSSAKLIEDLFSNENYE